MLLDENLMDDEVEDEQEGVDINPENKRGLFKYSNQLVSIFYIFNLKEKDASSF